MTRAPQRIPSRRGVALIYATALIVVLIGFVGLAIDVGRAQYLKSQLQLLADVAARSAARGIADGTTLAKANAVAPYNAPAGGPASFASSDVEVGSWDAMTKAFAAGGTSANAVRVTASRTGENALPMLFLQLLGSGPANVSASAVAVRLPSTPAYGAFGSNNIHLHSNVLIDSYHSSVAPYNASWTPDQGNVASNGPFQLHGSATVRGDAYAGPNQRVRGGTVMGLRGSLDEELSFPDPITNGYSSSNNDNANIPATYRSGDDFSVTSNVTVTLPGGNYYFDDFTMTNGLLNVTGPATLYVSSLSFTNDARTSAHRPQNLKIVVYDGGAVNLDGDHGVYADIYAPRSAARIDGNKHLYGRIVARILHADSNARIHVDESLLSTPNPGTPGAGAGTGGGGGGGGGSGTVQLVR